jgi:hypothetical protein
MLPLHPSRPVRRGSRASFGATTSFSVFDTPSASKHRVTPSFPSRGSRIIRCCHIVSRLQHAVCFEHRVARRSHRVVRASFDAATSFRYRQSECLAQCSHSLGAVCPFGTVTSIRPSLVRAPPSTSATTAAMQFGHQPFVVLNVDIHLRLEIFFPIRRTCSNLHHSKSLKTTHQTQQTSAPNGHLG